VLHALLVGQVLQAVLLREVALPASTAAAAAAAAAAITQYLLAVFVHL
jgi:hypothetical protein